MPNKLRSRLIPKKGPKNSDSEIDEEEQPKKIEYVVESIRDKRKCHKGGSYEYLVKWQGYSSDENTWEPKENLSNAPDAMREFENKLLKKKQTSKKAPKSIEIEDSSDSDRNEESFEEHTEKKPNKKAKVEAKKPSLFSRKSARFSNIEEEDEEESSEDDEKHAEVDSGKIEKAGKGHFLLGDTAENIVHCKPLPDKIEFTVSWKERENGVLPNPTKFSSKELRRYNKDLLLDFYESKLKFVQPKKKNDE